jgi:hypothetical protein
MSPVTRIPSVAARQKMPLVFVDDEPKQVKSKLIDWKFDCLGRWRDECLRWNVHRTPA